MSIATLFKDIKYEKKEDTLNIYFNEVFVDGNTKKIDNRLIYKIETDKVDIIKVFKNGEEIKFDVIGN